MKIESMHSNLVYPDSIRGLYRGHWSNLTSKIPSSPPSDSPIEVRLRSLPRAPDSFSLGRSRGSITLHIEEELTVLDDLKIRGMSASLSSMSQNSLSQVSAIIGILVLQDGIQGGEGASEPTETDTTNSLDIGQATMQRIVFSGFYFSKSGELTLFGNVKLTDGRPYLFPSNSTLSPLRGLQEEDEVSSTTPSMNPDCLLRFDMQLDSLQDDTAPTQNSSSLRGGGSHSAVSDDPLRLSGVMSSVNCHDFVGINISSNSIFDERIVEKGMNYAFFVINIALFEIIVLASQMKYGASDAKMKKVSI
jgi:hypothetical protein